MPHSEEKTKKTKSTKDKKKVSKKEAVKEHLKDENSEENEPIKTENVLQASKDEDDKKDSEQSISQDADLTSSKRKELEEIEIDLEQPTPMSKKLKRLVKKGKASAPESETGDKEEKKKSEYGVWIGNLSFDTSLDDIKRFLTAKTSNLANDTDGSSESSEPIAIKEADMTRIKLPRGKTSIKGFAYVDFTKPQHVLAAVALSESVLNGRKLLIKNANSFEGRPEKPKTKADAAAAKSPPSRILFVGNLPFDTTEESLTTHFQHCGEIMRIRMATFEDSGKSKGFAFVDFRETEASTKALNDNRCYRFSGRSLRMEYGEDRSKRTKQEKYASMHKSDIPDAPKDDDANGDANGDDTLSNNSLKTPSEKVEEPSARPIRTHVPSRSFKPSNKRPSPGLALATAQRAKVSILPSQGKKVTFD